MIGLHKFQQLLTWAGLFALLSLVSCGGGGGGESAPANNVGSGVSSDVSSVSGIGSSSVGSGSAGSDDSGQIIVAAALTIIDWVPPSLRENDDFLRQIDLFSYRVYYGEESGDYLNRIDIVSSLEPEVDLTDLPSGVYFLVITSIDTDGRESLYSEEFSVTL